MENFTVQSFFQGRIRPGSLSWNENHLDERRNYEIFFAYNHDIRVCVRQLADY